MLSDRALRTLRKLLVATLVTGAGIGLVYFAFIRPTRIIDRLAERAHSELSLLPVPAADSPRVEIALREELRAAPANESFAITEAERLAVISRWTRELYPYFNAFMLACVLGPPSERIAHELRGATAQETAENIRSWAKASLLQAQSTEPFEDMPGSDPWGALNVFEPAYKKLLPSEMIAESLYTGKMTGKCCSLAALLAALFVLDGALPEDVVILRLRSHNIGLIRFAGESYVTSNQKIESLEDKPDEIYWIDGTRYKGFFGYPLALMRPVKTGTDILTSPATLLSSVASAAGAAELLQSIPAQVFASRETLLAAVFGTTAEERRARTYALARYAFQSLYVREPEAYLRASMRAPTARELARKLRTPESMIDWIRANIAYGSIFEDQAERLMTADQVIVFRRGGYKDQAVLFFTLLERNRIDASISITRDDAYVGLGARTWRVSTWQAVERIPDPVELELDLD